MKVQSLRAQVALANVPGPGAGDGRRSGAADCASTATRPAGWSGRIALTDAEIAVAGFADPLQLASAQVQIDGARLVVDRMDARLGKLAFTGDYRYEPGAGAAASRAPARGILGCRRPGGRAHAHAAPQHQPVRARAGPADGHQLAARAQSRWHRADRRIRCWAEHTWRTSARACCGTWRTCSSITCRRRSIRRRIARQAGRESARLASELQADREGEGIELAIGQAGCGGTIETFGTGLQLLTNLTAEGAFTGGALDLGTFGTARSVTGAYSLSWSQIGPRLRLTNLNVRTEDETYLGRGATQDDGRLVVLLNNGAHEMKMTGTLARLRVE